MHGSCKLSCCQTVYIYTGEILVLITIREQPQIRRAGIYSVLAEPLLLVYKYSKTCLRRSLKSKTKIYSQDRLLLNAGQKYCRMLHEEHSAILSTFIKLPFVVKTAVLSIFE